MRVLIDANILYPTVLRGLTLDCAARGLFVPFWSARILEEWARAAARLSPEQEVIARGEIAALRARFPDAEVAVDDRVMARLWLPDPNDIHVLAAAISGGCDAILTLNRRDFPRRILQDDGIDRFDPDELMLSLPRGPVTAAAEAQLAQLRALSGEDWSIRQLLRKAGLPRLGKALA